MKRFILSLVIILHALTGTAKRTNETICNPGFTYEISDAPNWGKGKPVVMKVYPYSSAEQAGLKQYDVIETINNVNVEELSPTQIFEMLNIAGDNDINLTITNLSVSNRRIMFRKQCKRSQSVTEEQLASSFSMYSLETTSERRFRCPFKTITTLEGIDFSQFRSFTFSPVDANNSSLEIVINESIEKELTKKGMVMDERDPDILIQTYYFFDKNPDFKGVNKMLVEKLPVYRYDMLSRKMVELPFLRANSPKAEAEYLLQLGFRFIDLKKNPDRVLWECEANELLASSYRLDDYARIHIPLMCMQYPYVKYERNVPFGVDLKIFNYTGISYDIDRLELVTAVDRDSPAYAAGIRARDVIQEIEGHSMRYSMEELSEAYRNFIVETMPYRDRETIFTDANGFSQCMYWDKNNYSQVAEILNDPNAKAPFSYLFYYVPYVNFSGNNTCNFRIKRGNSYKDVVIRPTLRTSVTIGIQ